MRSRSVSKWRTGLATVWQACSHPLIFASTRDPGWLIVKRSVRAAVVMPAAFALANAVTGDLQVPLFTSFGSFALLLLVDFGGGRASRMAAYAALICTGALLVVAGTLSSRSDALAVTAMVVVAFVVLFAGVLSPRAAQANMYLLLAFVLPVTIPVPPGQILPRLAGWGIAAALGLPALALIWPRPWHDRRRAALAGTANRLAAVTSALAGGQADDAANELAARDLGALREGFEATLYPATGTDPAEIALARMLGRMEWAGSLVLSPAGESAPATGGGAAAGPAVPLAARTVYAAAAQVLRTTGSLLGTGSGGPRPDSGAVAGHAAPQHTAGQLTAAIGTLRQAREASLSATIDRLASEQRLPGPPAATLGAMFRARSAGLATEQLAEEALQSVAAGAPPRWSTVRAMRRRARSHLTFRSVWLRNSVRGAAGLGAAIAVARIAGVQHAFWVALGTMSVLRSNAVGTGANALRAVAGTAAGFAAGAAIMIAVGPHITALWFALPVAVLIAGIAPSMISFAAGQAGFTIMVIILFNIMVPTGWSVGLVRIEDVSLGCAVSVGTGLLLWPRGASAELGHALGAAYSAGGRYLLSALRRLMSADPAGTAARTRTTGQGRSASASYQRLEDAYREFLSERGAKPVSLPTVTHLLTGAARLRLEAHALATLPVGPIERGSAGASGGPGALTEVETAAAQLDMACGQAAAWFAGFAGALDRRDPVPAIDALPERLTRARLQRHLLTAFDVAAASGEPALIRMSVRLLWAFEYVKDERDLQHDLAHAARLVAGQAHRRFRWRAPPRRARRSQRPGPGHGSGPGA